MRLKECKRSPRSWGFLAEARSKIWSVAIWHKCSGLHTPESSRTVMNLGSDPSEPIWSCSPQLNASSCSSLCTRLAVLLSRSSYSAINYLVNSMVSKLCWRHHWGSTGGNSAPFSSRQFNLSLLRWEEGRRVIPGEKISLEVDKSKFSWKLLRTCGVSQLSSFHLPSLCSSPYLQLSRPLFSHTSNCSLNKIQIRSLTPNS